MVIVESDTLKHLFNEVYAVFTNGVDVITVVCEWFSGFMIVRSLFR